MSGLSPCAAELKSFTDDLLAVHHENGRAETSPYFQCRDRFVASQTQPSFRETFDQAFWLSPDCDAFLSTCPVPLDWLQMEHAYQQSGLKDEQTYAVLIACEAIFQLAYARVHTHQRERIIEQVRFDFLPALLRQTQHEWSKKLGCAVEFALETTRRVLGRKDPEAPDGGLYIILNPTAKTTADELCHRAMQAIAGGASMLQLRCKEHTLEQTKELARTSGKHIQTYGVPYLINDLPELVDHTCISGVHVGLTDASISQCRDLLGENTLIGASSHTKADRHTILSGPLPTYIAVGPIFESRTKSGHAHCVGIARLREATQTTPLPICAIGGLDTPSRIAAVARAGAHWAAIVSAFSNAPDPIWTSTKLSAIFHSTKETA